MILGNLGECLLGYATSLMIWACYSNDDAVTFKTLTCKKDGNHYNVQVQLNTETLEMELQEMVRLFEQRFEYNSRYRKDKIYQFLYRQEVVE